MDKTIEITLQLISKNEIVITITDLKSGDWEQEQFKISEEGRQQIVQKFGEKLWSWVKTLQQQTQSGK